jgi:hypothetical protein
MKTIILLGIALLLGSAAMAQGTANTHGSSDWYAYNPLVMSKDPGNADGIQVSPGLLIKWPIHITPEDGFPSYPNQWVVAPTSEGNIDGHPGYPNSNISEPNNDPNHDGMPKYNQASFVVRHHGTY